MSSNISMNVQQKMKDGVTPIAVLNLDWLGCKVVSTGDGHLQIWEGEYLNLTNEISLESPQLFLASYQNRDLLVTASTHEVTVLKVSEGFKKLHTFRSTHGRVMAMKTLSERYLGVLFADRTFQLWDLKALIKVKEILLQGAITEFADTHSKKQIVFSGLSHLLYM